MIRAYDDNGNVFDLVEYENQIRTDEKTKTIKDFVKWVDETYTLYFGVNQTEITMQEILKDYIKENPQ